MLAYRSMPVAGSWGKGNLSCSVCLRSPWRPGPGQTLDLGRRLEMIAGGHLNRSTAYPTTKCLQRAPEEIVSRQQIVTESQLNTIDKFVVEVLKAHQKGTLALQDAMLDIGHVLVAIDKGNEAEYTSWVVERSKQLKAS